MAKIIILKLINLIIPFILVGLLYLFFYLLGVKADNDNRLNSLLINVIFIIDIILIIIGIVWLFIFDYNIWYIITN